MYSRVCVHHAVPEHACGWLAACVSSPMVCRGGFGTTVGEPWIYGLVEMSRVTVKVCNGPLGMGIGGCLCVGW